MVDAAHRNRSDLVWYIAYGSNLLRERFVAYLTGGPGPRGAGHHDGARNPALPLADRPVRIHRRLIFAGESKRWGGGVCAVTPTSDSEPVGSSHSTSTSAWCFGRAWLITADQLLDVWRQENGGLRLSCVSWDDLETRGWCDDPLGRYRRLDRLEPVDGIRAVTITCGPELSTETNRPSPAYVAVVSAGLREAWSLSATEADAYLEMRLPGS